MKPFLVLITFCLTSLSPLLWANDIAVVPLTPAYISSLVEEMRTNHPALRAADARVRAAEFNAAGIRIWEDPMLFMGTQVAEQAMRADEGNLIYGVTQKLPLFGKPQAMQRAARAEAGVEGAEAAYTFQTLRRDLAMALFQAALAQRVVAISREDQTWLETILASLEARFRAGQVSLTYLAQAQNELSRRTNSLHTEQRQLTLAQENLNRLLNRPLDSPWPALGLPGIAEPIPLTPEVIRLGQTFEPRAQMLRERVRAADARTQATRKARYPDIGLDFEGRNYTGNGEFRQAMILVTATFPLGNAAKYRRDIWRDEDRARAARLDVADQELAIRQELVALVVAIDAARREALLYRHDILPRSEQALAAAQSDWETGRVSFREVLDAHRMVLEARLMLARAITEQWRQLSDLVLCCGLGDLEALDLLRPATMNENSLSTQP